MDSGQTVGDQKFYLYARKSTDVEDKQVLSIEAQLIELREYAKREGLVIASEYIEKKSAKAPGRPVLGAMLAAIERSGGNILAWHPDRLARNSVDGGQIVYLLDSGTIGTLKFPSFWFENTSQGKFMLSIAFGQSKYYVDNLSENTKRGLRQKVRRGEYPGRAPIGYINDVRIKRVVVDTRRSPVVLAAFELYATGTQRLQDIAIFLSSHKITTKGGKLLTKDQIKRILVNPFYYGHFLYCGEVYEGKHPPIISKQLFDEVQAVLLRRGRPQKGVTEPQVFCGLLSCGSCGLSVTAEHKIKHQKNGNIHEYVYYRCTKKRKDMKCVEPAVTETELNHQVSTLLSEYAMPQSWAIKLEALLVEEAKKASDASSVFVAKAEGKLVGIQGKLQRLLDGYLDQDIEQSVYRTKQNELMSQKKTLEEQVSRLTLASHAWVEPMRQWIQEASGLWKIAKSNDLMVKKNKSKDIFGLNLTLKNKQLQLCHPKLQTSPLKKQWTALHAARQRAASQPKSLSLVPERGLEPPSLAA